MIVGCGSESSGEVLGVYAGVLLLSHEYTSLDHPNQIDSILPCSIR